MEAFARLERRSKPLEPQQVAMLTALIGALTVWLDQCCVIEDGIDDI